MNHESATVQAVQTGQNRNLPISSNRFIVKTKKQPTIGIRDGMEGNYILSALIMSLSGSDVDMIPSSSSSSIARSPVLFPGNGSRSPPSSRPPPAIGCAGVQFISLSSKLFLFFFFFFLKIYLDGWKMGLKIGDYITTGLLDKRKEK